MLRKCWAFGFCVFGGFCAFEALTGIILGHCLWIGWDIPHISLVIFLGVGNGILRALSALLDRFRARCRRCSWVQLYVRWAIASLPVTTTPAIVSLGYYYRCPATLYDYDPTSSRIAKVQARNHT